MGSSTENFSGEQAMIDEHLKNLSKNDIDAIIRTIRMEIQRELDLYASFLFYRVERDLYELLLNDDRLTDMDWPEFLLVLQQDNNLRSKSAAILVASILELPQQAYFTPPEEGEFDAISTEDFLSSENLRCIQLLPTETGRAVVHLVMVQGQLFLRARKNEEGLALTWKEFQDLLYADADLWNDFLRCFRNALRQINFKALWQLEGWSV